MADRIKNDELAQSIAEWFKFATGVTQSYVPLLQIAQTASLTNTAALAQSVQVLKENYHGALHELAAGLVGVREVMKPTAVAWRQLAAQYHEALAPLISALTAPAVPVPHRLHQNIDAVPSALVEKVAAYAQQNPAVIVVDETGEKSVVEMVHDLKLQLNGLQEKATHTQKKNTRITFILFVLGILVPQLLFGGGPAEKGRKELQQGVMAIVEKLHDLTEVHKE